MEKQWNSLFENTRIAYDLWTRLTEYICDAVGQRAHKGGTTPRDYIDRNYYRNELNLDMAADHAGMSKYYMCKEFHREVRNFTRKVSPGTSDCPGLPSAYDQDRLYAAGNRGEMGWIFQQQLFRERYFVRKKESARINYQETDHPVRFCPVGVSET